MNRSSVADRAAAFSALHKTGAAFVIPNIWDAVSARIFEDAGFPAIATSSASMAWSLGYADGETVDQDALFAAIARVVRVVRVPVSADLEAGFGAGIEPVVRSFERAVAAGVVGANFEDYDNDARDVVPLEIQVARVRAVRERADALGVHFYINARTDILLHGLGPHSTRVERTIERLRAFSAAGADGVFAPGVSDLATIEHIVRSVDKPLNILAEAQTPPRSALARAGVARVSIGSSPARRTLFVLGEIARSLRDGDDFLYARDPALQFDELNRLFS
jgi:2-methylisocitrate lyase-like PEP mutase family enzyme